MSGSGILPTVRVGEVVPPPAHDRWLVHSIWSASAVGIIGGPPKACKTWFALDLAVSVATGTPCLGSFAVERPGPVLAYLAEDSLERGRERIEGLCRVRGLALASLDLHLITAPVLRLDLAPDAERLAATVAKLRPRLLLLDPFVRLHRIDENNAGEVSRILADLRVLQRTHDVAVVLVHHARKNGGGSAGQALRGSSDLFAWVDSYAYLRPRDRGLSLSLEHRSEPAIEPIPLRMAALSDGSCPHLALDAADPNQPPPQPALESAILRELATTGASLTRTLLRARLQVNNQRLGSVLEELARQQRIVRSPDGWSMPPP